MALYLEEVDVIRQALQLEGVHILGHSWGGMLAMEYALTQPNGLVSLILANTGASICPSGWQRRVAWWLNFHLGYSERFKDMKMKAQMTPLRIER